MVSRSDITDNNNHHIQNNSNSYTLFVIRRDVVVPLPMLCLSVIVCLNYEARDDYQSVLMFSRLRFS
jgi:hypothetical protein